MDLPTYIQALGDEEAAKLFGVKERTAQAWRYGYRRPRPKKALEVEKLTRGKVTFSEIYSETPQ